MMETAEIAVKALEIMDRDGWTKGMFTRRDGSQGVGSHCGGGIWSLACGFDSWADEEWYVPLWEKVREMFPEQAARAEDYFAGCDFHGASFIHTALARTVRWNDYIATEEDVRQVFEKLAAG